MEMFLIIGANDLIEVLNANSPFKYVEIQGNQKF
jgi:hypothetical protein